MQIHLDASVENTLACAGLADTVWAGRTQTLKNGEVTYFLDGAHTTRSMQACVSWFQEAAVRCERNAR